MYKTMLNRHELKEISDAAGGSLQEFTATARRVYINAYLSENDLNVTNAAKAMRVTRWALYSAMRTLGMELNQEQAA
jgi:DNA-binding NtrC family response regulator